MGDILGFLADESGDGVWFSDRISNCRSVIKTNGEWERWW